MCVRIPAKAKKLLTIIAKLVSLNTLLIKKQIEAPKISPKILINHQEN
jgi:hypothetical protein